MSRALTILTLICLMSAPARAAEITWRSDATGQDVRGRLLLPAEAKQEPLPTVIYLVNLNVPRLGQEPDDPILADLVKSGHLVLVLDYARHACASSPNLNADVLKLRRDVAKTKTLLAEHPVDGDRLFIMPEGFRLKRDVEFARDGDRLLAMDVIYPARPLRPVPVLMEVTCDNVNRMGSSSLLFCHDTLLEGGPIAGFAGAMIDHPVAPPYKGLDDPIPQVIDRLKAAAKTLRGLSDECNLNRKIGVIGFSRGGTMAALLAAPGAGDVQAALIHGNRYDYLDLRSDDPMLPRFEKAWGPRDQNRQRWAEHGAAHYLTRDCPPIFLNTSDAESAEFRDGLEKFAARLEALGVEHVYRLDRDGRGHRVTTDPIRLQEIYAFFRSHLGG